jgi:hypothetical protein
MGQQIMNLPPKQEIIDLKLYMNSHLTVCFYFFIFFVFCFLFVCLFVCYNVLLLLLLL